MTRIVDFGLRIADFGLKIEIAPRLYRLAGLLGVNAYLWRPDDGADAEGPILFDCGYPWSGRELAAGLEGLGCRPAHIRAIAVTHADFDHIGRLAPLAAAAGAEVLAHEQEAPRITASTWRRLPGSGRSLDPLVLAAPFFYRQWPPRPVRVTRPLRDGEEIGGGWVAVHTPGHTPGHTAYFRPASRTLIAGDALGSVRRGQVRLPKRVYADDWSAALASVHKLAALEPEIICFGHGPELYGAAEMLHRLTERLLSSGAS